MRPSSGPCKMSIETLTLSAYLGGFKAQTNREGVSNTGCPATPTAYAEDHDTVICERAESGRRVQRLSHSAPFSSANPEG